MGEEIMDYVALERIGEQVPVPAAKSICGVCTGSSPTTVEQADRQAP